MANPRKGEIELSIGGKNYTYLLGTYGLAKLEQRIGKPWPLLFKQAAEGGWGFDAALAVFHAGLLLHHEPMTEKEASMLLDELTVVVFMEKFAAAIKLQFPDPGPDADPTRPATQQANGGIASFAIG